jgi:hypothetical protein
VVERHGGVDYRLVKGYADLCTEDGLAVDDGDGFRSKGIRQTNYCKLIRFPLLLLKPVI